MVYHLELETLSVADATIERFKERISQLYEQEPLHKKMKWLGVYWLRWIRWATSGGVQLSTDNISIYIFGVKSLCFATPKPQAGECK